MIKSKWLYFFVVLFIISSCNTEEIVPLHHPPNFLEIPKGFDDIVFPNDNFYTEERWELGKKLFFDPIMSLDSTISCGTCHKPEFAFSDNVDFSIGVNGGLGTRNSPSLANVAYHPYYTREGGVPTLEMQVLVPIQEHNEFDFNIVLLANRLLKDSTYINMSQLAYDREPDAYVITRSLSCFERSLISGYSRYDQYTEYGDSNALNGSEIRGMKLFFSDKTQCSTCHSGFNFTNYKFENNGLYDVYDDKGRYRLTGQDIDLAKFKIPSLRNIELTAPYMHDGSMNSLNEVVEHYNNGGKSNPQKSSLIKPLGLTETEKRDLISFLESLTDDSFANNPIFYN